MVLNFIFIALLLFCVDINLNTLKYFEILWNTLKNFDLVELRAIQEVGDADRINIYGDERSLLNIFMYDVYRERLLQGRDEGPGNFVIKLKCSRYTTLNTNPRPLRAIKFAVEVSNNPSDLATVKEHTDKPKKSIYPKGALNQV